MENELNTATLPNPRKALKFFFHFLPKLARFYHFFTTQTFIILCDLPWRALPFNLLLTKLVHRIHQLDEREREEFFRLKKIQEKKAQAIARAEEQRAAEDLVEKQQHLTGQFSAGK